MKPSKPTIIVVNVLYACCFAVLPACYKTGNEANDSSVLWNDGTNDADAKNKIDEKDSDTSTRTVTDAKTDADKKIIIRPPDVHRPVALSCEGVHSPPDPGGAENVNFGSCTQHADCTEGENGKCVARGIGMSAGYRYCAYDQCFTDDDCDKGRVCYCTPRDAARCLSVGNCQVDADCGPGGYCSPSMGSDCSGYHTIDGYHCRTPADTCVDDSDCTGSDYCNFEPYKNLWECTPINMGCAIG